MTQKLHLRFLSASVVLIGGFGITGLAQSQNYDPDEPQRSVQTEAQADVDVSAAEQVPPPPTQDDEFSAEQQRRRPQANQPDLDDPSERDDQQSGDEPRRDDPDNFRDDRQFEQRQLDSRRNRDDDQSVVGRAIQSTRDLGLELAEQSDGLSIVQIDRDSRLIDSGLRQGDVIIGVRQRPLRNSSQFLRWYLSLNPGVRVPVQIVRDGQRETIYITRVDRDRWAPSDLNEYGPHDGSAYLGVVFDDRYPATALIEVVRRDTAAERAGLRPGDVIQRINGQQIYGVQHATALIGQLQPGSEIELEFSRRTMNRTVATLGQRSDSQQAAFYGDYDSLNADGYDSTRAQFLESETADEDTQRVRPLRQRDRERRPVRDALTRPFRNP